MPVHGAHRDLCRHVLPGGAFVPTPERDPKRVRDGFMQRPGLVLIYQAAAMADQPMRGFVTDQLRKVQHGIGENHGVRRYPEGHEFVAGTLGDAGNPFVESRPDIAHERLAVIVDTVDLQNQAKKPVVRAERVEQALRIAVPAADRLGPDKRRCLDQCQCPHHRRARVHRPADACVPARLREVMDAAVQDLTHKGKPQENFAVGGIKVEMLKRLRQVLPREFLRILSQALLDERWAGPGEAAAVVGWKYYQRAVILGGDGQTRQHLGEHNRGCVIVDRNGGVQPDIRGGIARDPDDSAPKRGDNHFSREYRNAAILLAHPENRRFAQLPRSAYVRKRIADAEPPTLAQFLRNSLGNVLAGFDGTVQSDVGRLEPDGGRFSLSVGQPTRFSISVDASRAARRCLAVAGNARQLALRR